MRKNQVNIVIESFEGETANKMAVYADADNVWEAVCAAFAEVTAVLQENGFSLPANGEREHQTVHNLPKVAREYYTIERPKMQAFLDKSRNSCYNADRKATSRRLALEKIS